MNEATGRVADATGNWVDSRAPIWAQPYLRLARLTGRSGPGYC